MTAPPKILYGGQVNLGRGKQDYKCASGWTRTLPSSSQTLLRQRKPPTPPFNLSSNYIKAKWWAHLDSNQGPSPYKSDALTAELCAQHFAPNLRAVLPACRQAGNH